MPIYEVYTSDGSLCESCANGMPSNSCEDSCTNSLPCDDDNPATQGEYEVYAPDGSLCQPCGNGVEIGDNSDCEESLVIEINQDCSNCSKIKMDRINIAKK